MLKPIVEHRPLLLFQFLLAEWRSCIIFHFRGAALKLFCSFMLPWMLCLLWNCQTLVLGGKRLEECIYFWGDALESKEKVYQVQGKCTIRVLSPLLKCCGVKPKAIQLHPAIGSSFWPFKSIPFFFAKMKMRKFIST